MTRNLLLTSGATHAQASNGLILVLFQTPQNQLSGNYIAPACELKQHHNSLEF